MPIHKYIKNSTQSEYLRVEEDREKRKLGGREGAKKVRIV